MIIVQYDFIHTYLKQSFFVLHLTLNITEAFIAPTVEHLKSLCHFPCNNKYDIDFYTKFDTKCQRILNCQRKRLISTFRFI